VRQRGLGSLLTSGMATITGPERIGDEIQLVWEHIESSPYDFRATTLTLALYQKEAKRFTSARGELAFGVPCTSKVKQSSTSTRRFDSRQQNSFGPAADAMHIIFVSSAAMDSLTRFDSLSRGRPIPLRRGFGRYLYFSVITMTTVGYGDFVPLSDKTRALVELQALFGIVLAGLFINAVAVRSAASSSNPPARSRGHDGA